MIFPLLFLPTEIIKRMSKINRAHIEKIKRRWKVEGFAPSSIGVSLNKWLIDMKKIGLFRIEFE